MFKLSNAVIISAAIATVFTVLTESTNLVAGPMPQQVQSDMKACTQQPWPYLNCVGTPYGNPKIRVVK